MEPRCNHLGNSRGDAVYHGCTSEPQWSPGVITWETAARRGEQVDAGVASMEPRCNHLGNEAPSEAPVEVAVPQWSPGVITWETRTGRMRRRTVPPPQWSPGVITWETTPSSRARGGRASLNGAQV